MKGSHAKLAWFGIGAVCALLVALLVPSCAKKHKVERGGVAEAASRPGRGTTVTVTLPRVPTFQPAVIES